LWRFDKRQVAPNSGLGELAGHLTHEEMWGIDEALTAVLGLR
jgi:hypothetical protein